MKDIVQWRDNEVLDPIKILRKLQAKFKAAIITGLCLKAYQKKWLNGITGGCGCNATATFQSGFRYWPH